MDYLPQPHPLWCAELSKPDTRGERHSRYGRVVAWKPYHGDLLPVVVFVRATGSVVLGGGVTFAEEINPDERDGTFYLGDSLAAVESSVDLALAQNPPTNRTDQQ